MLAHKTAETIVKETVAKPARVVRNARSKAEDSGAASPEQGGGEAAEVFAVDRVDASFLESLLGYNARRASLSLVGVFVESMERFDLKIALGKRGFLERRPHPRDGRATGLYLSAAGRELVDAAEPELKSRETQSITHLSEMEQTQLRELLQKLYR